MVLRHCPVLRCDGAGGLHEQWPSLQPGWHVQPSGQQCAWSGHDTAFGPDPMQQPRPEFEKAVTMQVELAGHEVGPVAFAASASTHGRLSNECPCTTPWAVPAATRRRASSKSAVALQTTASAGGLPAAPRVLLPALLVVVPSPSSSASTDAAVWFASSSQPPAW